ncbi:MAG: GlxA family transcriptional regulator [Variibacter sp.]
MSIKDRTSPIGPKTIGFLLVENFSLLSFAVAVEPLRAANVLSGRNLYAWRFIAPNEIAATASIGVKLHLDGDLASDERLDMLFVCAGGNPALHRDPATFRWLRRLARRGTPLGGISGGSYALARAGLLDKRRCTIHWEHMAAFREEFPHIDLRATLFEIDRDRYSCAGGIASLDMMHAIIEADHGAALANAVTEWFIQTSVRPGSGAQRMEPRERLRILNESLIKAIKFMERRFDEPIGVETLAGEAGVSARHLQRLFAQHLGMTVEKYLFSLRLNRGRELLRQSDLPVLDVALAAGFSTAGHFSRSYKAKFGLTPRDERRSARAVALRPKFPSTGQGRDERDRHA